MAKLKRKYSRPIAFILLLILSAAIFSGCDILNEIDAAVSDIAAASVIEQQTDYDTAESVQPDETSEIESESDYPETVYYTFRSEKYLKEHFEKHNSDFGYANEQEYLDGANRVINDKNALHKTEAEDGDDVYYLENTNEFVIVSTDGYIRTYFKPSRGIEYYNKQ